MRKTTRSRTSATRRTRPTRGRLQALPFARHCIDCQRVIEEEERMATG
ncbi:MAG: hypothetical protein DME07_02605 [Candidatus Rokuibacteriota bacterium]|nr:MAG: hypothetical protein DME07_02605 [Candidatus Rokubacteria bacterium]